MEGHVFGCVFFAARKKGEGMKKWFIPEIRAGPMGGCSDSYL